MSSEIKISIVATTFNHEKYVGEFLDSVLAQTYQNWELIIVDDCSTDSNVEQIKKYTDSRICLIEQPYNQGPGAALNTAFPHITGDVVIDLSADDKLHTNYFEFLTKAFEDKELDLVYPSHDVINLKGKKWMTSHCTQDKTKIELLKHFFEIYNCLPSPGLAARKSLYSKIIPMQPSLVQHQDYQWHILFMIFARNIRFENTPYVFYRYEPKGTSLGSISMKKYNRERLEIDSLMDTFLQIKDMSLVKAITGSPLCDILSENLIPFILAMHALELKSQERRIWGYEILCHVFDDAEYRKELYEKLNWTFKDFLAVADREIYKDYSKIGEFFRSKIDSFFINSKIMKVLRKIKKAWLAKKKGIKTTLYNFYVFCFKHRLFYCFFSILFSWYFGQL